MFRSFHSFIAALVVTGSLASAAVAAPGQVCYFGECGSTPSPRSDTAPVGGNEPSRALPAHGSWSTVTAGDTTVIMDRFEDGAVFGIAYTGGTASVVMTAPKRQLHEGDTIGVKIDVDGDVFNGKAVAISETAVMVTNIGADFTREFYSARKVQVFIADDTFTMTSLADASAALEDAKLYRPTSTR